MLDGAQMWYRCRVERDTTREAVETYYRGLDPFDVSKRLEPYDDAIGYHRHE